MHTINIQFPWEHTRQECGLDKGSCQNMNLILYLISNNYANVIGHWMVHPTYPLSELYSTYSVYYNQMASCSIICTRT